MTHQAATT